MTGCHAVAARDAEPVPPSGPYVAPPAARLSWSA